MILPIQVMDQEMGDEQPDHATIASSSSDNTMSQTSPTPANNTVKVAAGYVLQQRLGSGSFASVYKGIKLDEYRQSVKNGQPPPPQSIAAIKAISRQSKKLTKKVLENLELEIAILRTYRHPNICCLHDVQKTERHIYLVLEYCGGGDLQRLIRTRQKGRLSEKLCRRLVRDLAAGLRFLWGKQVVHRDIKPQNLLLTGPLPPEDEAENPARENAKNVAQGTDSEVDNGGFMLQIADFGFARHLTGVDMAETMCGSPLYMAPEILSGEKYDAKADLWSVGTVLFEMISGKTPFHGENHLDLLRNIKTKAVRLPADVRVSKECVKLLKLTLDRKPHSRTDFKGFLEASEAFVALGCNGAPPSEASNTAPPNEMAFNSSQQIVDRGVCSRMNLCAISENDGLGESTHQQQRDYQHVQQSPMTNYIPNSGSAVQPQTHAMNTSVQPSKDSESKPGFVTPPFNALPTPIPPPALQTTSSQGNPKRVSVFAPLQASPNISPSVTPSGASPPAFSLQSFVSKQVSNLPLPRPGVLPIRLGDSNPRSGTHQQHQLNQTAFANNQTQARRNSAPKTSSHESSSSSESGFVFVDHTGSRSGSGTNSPSTSGLLRSPSLSPRSSSGRITILDAKNAGMLATSPGTGRALVGKMMLGSPPGRSNLSMTPTTSGKFPVSPRSALRQGGCLAHIETLARMLAASEDIGRRAITVAHLGDVRAYLAMGLLVAQRDESQSSLSSSTPMEGVVEDRRSSSTKQFVSNNTIEEEDEDDFPFAMATSSEEMSQSPAGNIMANLAPIIGNASNDDSNEEMSPCMIEVHFREALECYLKTLSMMKGSIRAAQKVLKEIEDVILNLSTRVTPDANNPYTPLRKRCNASLDWLQGQFSAVLERADAAEKQISKLQKANQTQQMEGSGSSVCVQELIYNHSLKCGREGAVKQLLGHYEAARSCYRSAGLLAETLLMESKVGEDDRSVLEGYVHSFADQIMELDDLIRATRSSRLGSQSTAASTIKRLSSTGASPAVAN
eukprot:CAMPEP_0201696848 /NCGR_PEP_ID=MMETSP0578-20130828/8359_1 /ASSEMBLY_ACC=CAM_ASM_000663 /TAXON_ID=267565 /ORGANISM="Skeletonema grethea, Strain CCMP 1804" /LENGTH=1014 /DNA_ID=CAMNT_0048182879 /DNA_START=384 /DNA_END=3428 /DNA_ORIENTATION=-